VVACYLISGSADFMVEAAVPDLAAYEQRLAELQRAVGSDLGLAHAAEAGHEERH